MTSRNWCFTLHDPSEEWFTMVNKEKIKYFVSQSEICPETKRRHMQGYFIAQAPCRIAQAKRWLGHDTAHLDVRRGTHEDAVAYCMKSDTRDLENFDKREFGVPPLGQGCRSDIVTLEELLKNGGLTIEDFMDLHFRLWLTFNRQIKEYIKIHDKPKAIEKTVEVIIDIPGSGKSRYCHEKYPDAYWLSPSNSRNLWFDGYSNQEVIILDDFNGSWIRYTELLRLLDRYPLLGEVKSSKVPIKANRIVITSNSLPRHWYNYDELKMFYGAVKRRITTCKRVSGQDIDITLGYTNIINSFVN